ncbi:MAG: STAS domain-containing protein [SAR324 cluster bacterium]|nr:STAS domain-containing protein [SAR324 cluster bacterium]
MELSYRIENDICVILLGGEVILDTLSEIERLFDELSERNFGGYILNLSQTTAIDSLGIGLISHFFQYMKQHQIQVVLCQLHPLIRWVFKNNIILMYETEADALVGFAC